MSKVRKLLHTRRLENGGDQQNRIGSYGFCLDNLIFVDSKIFSEYRTKVVFPGCSKVFIGSTKKILICQDRQRRSSGLHVSYRCLFNGYVRVDNTFGW